MCNNNATALADLVTVDQDPLNLIWVGSTFKDNIVFPYLIIVAIVFAFITFLLLATFPGWHTTRSDEGSEREVKPFPSRAVSQVALALIFIAAVFTLVSVLWQHTASVAASTVAQDLGNGSVKSGVGTAAMILGWFGFGLLVVVTLGLLVMILSIQLLDRLTDEVCLSTILQEVKNANNECRIETENQNQHTNTKANLLQCCISSEFCMHGPRERT